MTPPRNFTGIAFTDSVKAMQERHGSREAYERMGAQGARYRLDWREQLFVAERDTFYMATVGSNGWPYVQHRGGPRGFLKVLDETTLAFADYRGNRQYVSTGNVHDTGHIALILMDYPNRRRLKIWALANTVEAEEDPELVARVADDGYEASIERVFVLDVQAFDWNCPQHIVRRYTEDELAALGGHLREADA